MPTATPPISTNHALAIISNSTTNEYRLSAVATPSGRIATTEKSSSGDGSLTPDRSSALAALGSRLGPDRITHRKSIVSRSTTCGLKKGDIPEDSISVDVLIVPGKHVSAEAFQDAMNGIAHLKSFELFITLMNLVEVQMAAGGGTTATGAGELIKTVIDQNSETLLGLSPADASTLAEKMVKLLVTDNQAFATVYYRVKYQQWDGEKLVDEVDPAKDWNEYKGQFDTQNYLFDIQKLGGYTSPLDALQDSVAIKTGAKAAFIEEHKRQVVQ